MSDEISERDWNKALFDAIVPHMSPTWDIQESDARRAVFNFRYWISKSEAERARDLRLASQGARYEVITFDAVADACRDAGIIKKLSIDNIRMIAKHLTASLGEKRGGT